MFVFSADSQAGPFILERSLTGSGTQAPVPARYCAQDNGDDKKDTTISHSKVPLWW